MRWDIFFQSAFFLSSLAFQVQMADFLQFDNTQVCHYIRDIPLHILNLRVMREVLYKMSLLVVSALAYLMARIRKDNDSEGWVKIENVLFHDIFFYKGYWEYRPCDIVMAVISEIGICAGIVLLFLPLPDRILSLVFMAFVAVMVVGLIISFIVEAVIIHKRRKKADLMITYRRNEKLRKKSERKR